MIPAFLVLSVAMSLTNTTSRKFFARDHLKTNGDNLAFTLGTQFLSMLVLFFFGNPFRVSLYTLFLALMMGVDQVFSSVTYVKALTTGPVSLTSLFLQGMTLIISSLVGPLFFMEVLSIPQIVGMLLVLVAMVLITDLKQDKSISVNWLLLMLLNGVLGGLQGFFQKVLSKSPYADETTPFVFWTFCFSCIVTAVCLLFQSRNLKKEYITIRPKGFVLIAVILCALTSAGLNIVNLFLVAALPTAVFFPLVTCSILLLNAVIGIVFFKERLSKRQIAGFSLGIVALMLTAGVFG